MSILNGHPIDLFEEWFAQALADQPDRSEAMVLSTVSPEGRPHARTVLLKGVSRDGFRFFTNFSSTKGQDLDANPWVAMTLFWRETSRQVVIEGTASRLSDADSAAYWATRPRGSQLGGWASDQSKPIKSREDLDHKLAAVTQRFEGAEVPRPPHWGGYHVVPFKIEFWQGRENRFHDRFVFNRDSVADNWVATRLQP